MKKVLGISVVLVTVAIITAAISPAFLSAYNIENLLRRSALFGIIGIGASPACDGQILVTDDALGLFSDFTPKFVKRFAELGGEIERARHRVEDRPATSMDRP